MLIVQICGQGEMISPWRNSPHVLMISMCCVDTIIAVCAPFVSHFGNSNATMSVVAPFPPLSSTSSSPPLSTDYTSFRSLLTTSLPPPTGLTSYSYASVTALPAPTNLATGTISSGCGYYYNVLTGDTCASIATQHVGFFHLRHLHG
jgi:hypothetical protein